MSKRASLRSKLSKPVKCGRVTHVSVSRLYNLGNYQNIKYDLSAEIAPGESAQETFRALNLVLQELKPFSKPSNAIAHLKDVAGKDPSELSEYQKANLKEWEAEAAEYALRRSRFVTAVCALDDLGGHSLFRDAKDTWRDDDDLLF